jgi:hypothetical protein
MENEESMSTTEIKTPATDFPGLERNALQMFGIPYAELPVRFQAGVRKVTKQDAAEQMLEALKACQLQMLQSNNDSEYAQEANELANAAIRKAEGKQ